jgi:hypothetical protein
MVGYVGSRYGAFVEVEAPSSYSWLVCSATFCFGPFGCCYRTGPSRSIASVGLGWCSRWSLHLLFYANSQLGVSLLLRCDLSVGEKSRLRSMTGSQNVKSPVTDSNLFGGQDLFHNHGHGTYYGAESVGRAALLWCTCRSVVAYIRT